MKKKAKNIGEFHYTGTEELENMEYMVNYNRSIANLILKFLKDPKKIVDFGAGIGTIAKIIRKKHKNILCVEIDPRQKQLLESDGFSTAISLDKAPNNSITSLYSSNVLEHIEDDYGIVKEIYKKMAPDGQVVFYVPALQSLYTSMDARVGHFRRYDAKRLRDVFQSGGFTVEKIFYRDCIGVPVTFLFKMIGSKDGATNRSHLILYDRLLFPISHFLDFFFQHLFGKNLVLVARKNPTTIH